MLVVLNDERIKKIGRIFFKKWNDVFSSAIKVGKTIGEVK